MRDTAHATYHAQEDENLVEKPAKTQRMFCKDELARLFLDGVLRLYSPLEDDMVSMKVPERPYGERMQDCRKNGA